MYADDMIIMSTTQEGLQKCLNELNEYCEKWKLNVNQKNNKCMIVSKAPNTRNIKFTINSKIIENRKEFKYLGISINSKDCSFKPALSDLSSKANKAIYSLLSKIPVKLIPVKTMQKLFDSCIAPILLYGSEVWAPFMNFDWKHWDTTQIEKTHTIPKKNTRGQQLHNQCLVRSEVGRHSVQETILTRNINYIKYIDRKDPQALVKQPTTKFFT